MWAAKGDSEEERGGREGPLRTGERERERESKSESESEKEREKKREREGVKDRLGEHSTIKPCNQPEKKNDLVTLEQGFDWTIM